MEGTLSGGKKWASGITDGHYDPDGYVAIRINVNNLKFRPRIINCKVKDHEGIIICAFYNASFYNDSIMCTTPSSARLERGVVITDNSFNIPISLKSVLGHHVYEVTWEAYE